MNSINSFCWVETKRMSTDTETNFINLEIPTNHGYGEVSQVQYFSEKTRIPLPNTIKFPIKKKLFNDSMKIICTR